MSLSLMMVVVAAVASLNVALPELAKETGATQSELQWIVDAYALAGASLTRRPRWLPDATRFTRDSP